MKSLDALRHGFNAAMRSYRGEGTYLPTSTGREQVDLSGNKTISYAEIYETQPWVAAAVNMLFRQISTIPLKVYRRDADGERERVEGTSLNTLLRRPAPYRSAADLQQWLSQPLFVHGNSLVAKYRGDGPSRPPTELLPLDWRFASGYARMGGPVEFWGTIQTGEERHVSAKEVLHVAWESPSTPVGVSPLKQLGVTIRIEDGARRYQIAAFDNGVRPGSVLIPPDGFRYRDGQREELREELESMHGGVDNAMRMGLLAPGFDVKPLSYSAVEAELMSQRQLDREEVSAVYGMPGPLIGDLTHGTYSNVSELHKMLYKTVLRPWLALIEQRVQAQLISPEQEWAGLFVEFDLAEQLRGSKEEEIGALTSATGAGLMTLNEARRVLNLPKSDEAEADQLLVPTNNLTPLGQTSGEAPDTTGSLVEPRRDR